MASIEREREALIGVSPRQWLIVLVGGLLFFTGFVCAHGPRALEQNQENAEPGKNGKEPKNAVTVTAVESPKDIRNLLEEGHLLEAEKSARTLLVDVEARSGRDSLDAAEVLDLLVEALWRGGKAKNQEGKGLGERALAIKEKTLGPQDLRVAATLNNLGILLSISGDYNEARPFIERALAIQEKTLGPNHPDVGRTLNALAILLEDTGDYAGARPLFERALAIREKSLPPDHPQLAASLNNLGVLFWVTGDFTAARPLLERALAIEEKVMPRDHPQIAGTLGNLALVRCAAGDASGAKHYYERALAIFEKTLGANHPDVGKTLGNLGALLAFEGDYTAAKPLLERALSINEKALGPEHPEVAENINHLADALAVTGDYARRRALYERALAIREKVLGPSHPLVGATLHSLAQLLAETGETSAAIESVLRAEEIRREHLRLTIRTLTEREALAYSTYSPRTHMPSGMNLALSLADPQIVKAPAARQAIWDCLIRSRALVLDEMAARHRTIARAEDPDVSRLGKQLVSTSERLASLVVRDPGSDPSGRYADLLEDARRQKEQAERALAEKSVAFRDEQAKTRLGLVEVTAALPSDSALVAFARYRRHDLAQRAPPGKPPEPVLSYLAFVLRQGESVPTVVPLGKAERIDGLVAKWREQMALEATAGGRSPKRSEAAYRSMATQLRREVWDPLVPHMGGAERVFIVPDGALHLLNFAGLPVGETRYLVETRPLIHYLSAERDLVPVGARQVNEGLLAIGAPAFDETKSFAALTPKTKAHEEGPPVQVAALHTFRGSRSACGQFQSMRFEPLPAAAQEAEEIATLWKKGTSSKQGERAHFRGAVYENRDGVLYLNGAGANEAAFKQHAPGKRVLHLATHGFFLGGQCASALDQSLESAHEAQPDSVTGENPLLLAGLALAGANHRQAAGPNEEDGVLTAEEIAAMDLEGVEWAVLSGCDTGIGEVKAGEGVFGLRRAFQVAGARTVIMSLWPVEDQAARQWMATLYRRRFLKGLDTAESVRDASLAVLRQRRAKSQSTHPFYWAGFIAAGDWR